MDACPFWCAGPHKEHIENIIKSAEKCNKIEAIVLFGSSLEDRCREESDIDIAIISRYTIDRLSRYKSFRNFTDRIYGKDTTQSYDILYFKSSSEIEKKKEMTTICGELSQKGKVIYRVKGDENGADFTGNSKG